MRLRMSAEASEADFERSKQVRSGKMLTIRRSVACVVVLPSFVCLLVVF